MMILNGSKLEILRARNSHDSRVVGVAYSGFVNGKVVMESLKVIVENNAHGQFAVKSIGWAAMRPRFQSASTTTDDDGGAPDGSRQRFLLAMPRFIYGNQAVQQAEAPSRSRSRSRSRSGPGDQTGRDAPRGRHLCCQVAGPHLMHGWLLMACSLGGRTSNQASSTAFGHPLRGGRTHPFELFFDFDAKCEFPVTRLPTCSPYSHHIHGTCARRQPNPNQRDAARIRRLCHHLFCCSLVLKRSSRATFETQFSVVFDFLPVSSAKIFIVLASISRAHDAQFAVQSSAPSLLSQRT
ncbi:hypothetical protein IWX47DRAFT_1928 [Phyllosticta citricarpa]